MRSSHIVTSAVGGLLVTLFACSSSPSADATAPSEDGGAEAATAQDATAARDAGGRDAKVPTPPRDGGTRPPPIVGPAGSDECTTATEVPLDATNPRIDLSGDTRSAGHSVDVPCSSSPSPDVFYRFAFSKRVFLYADTFGASWNTVLYLLSDSCTPITTQTMTGDAVCSDDACGTQQSRLVALLEPGYYRLGLSGAAGAKGAATIHFEWVQAGSGAVLPLPSGHSVLTGATVAGGGNLTGLSSDCLAAGAEDSYWWARCPSDPGGALSASTCGGTTWESVVSVQVPAAEQYACNVDGCGLQAELSTTVPAGAGLGVVSVDGQQGSDFGDYTLTVDRP
jgi:hypothetical protein